MSYFCSAVSINLVCRAAALLGRFLPRLGPFDILGGPFSFQMRSFDGKQCLALFGGGGAILEKFRDVPEHCFAEPSQVALN